MSHVTGGGLAANLARVLPRADRHRRPLDLDPGTGLRPRRQVGGVRRTTWR